MKKPVMCLLSVFLLCVGFMPVQGQDAPEFDRAQIEKFAKDIMNILDEDALVRLMELPMKLKEAGASYQASLLFPLDKADQYEDGEGLRVVSGAYWADAAYAFFFNKIEEADRYMAAANDLFEKALDESGCEFDYNRTVLMERFVTEIDKADTTEVINIAARYIAQENEMIMVCPMGIDTVVDNLHGLVMESVFLSSGVILAMGGDEEVMKTLDIYMDYVEIMNKLLALFESDPDYAVMVEAAERKPMLKAIQDTIKKGNPTVEDVKKLRDIVTPERRFFMNAK